MDVIHVGGGMSIAYFDIKILVCVILAAVVLVVTIPLYSPRFLGIKWRWGTLLLFGAWLCAAAVMADRLGLLREHQVQLAPSHLADGGTVYRTISVRGFAGLSTLESMLSVLFAGLLVVFAVPFAVRLYMKWAGKFIQEREKALGADGVRAWLSWQHVLLAVTIAICAWQGFWLSVFGMLALTIGLLIAYPVLRTLFAADQYPQATTIPSADLSDERQRVLKLLEAGRITAEEGSELLHALGETTRPEPPMPKPMTTGRKLLLVGAMLVIVGFFLPWYSINISQGMAQAGQLMSDYSNQMSRNMGSPPMPSGAMPMPQMAMTSGGVGGIVRVAGGDVAHGLGWIVLLLGVLAAAITFVKLDVSKQTQKILMVGPVMAGAFILVYLLTNGLGGGAIVHVEYALLLVLAGYAAEFVGILKDIRSGT
jgi:hypothetical protein